MSFRVSHFGKNGDLVYALPVIKALARKRGEKITLLTSPLCYQLVPLLWEQPYLQDVEMDYSRAYRIDDRGSLDPWNVLAPEEGLNLSPQPSMYRPNAPVPWTLAYAEIAGVEELAARDRIALPTLWNHRQWYWEHAVKSEGKDGIAKEWKPPRTLVLSPESETLKCISLKVWADIARALKDDYEVLVIGTKPDPSFRMLGVRDLRGVTTVSSVARLLAEATLVISANSLPWHLARHAGTPTFCFQDQYLERCVPVDTPYVFYTSDKTDEMIEAAREIAAHPVTTLLKPHELRRLEAA